MDEQNSIVDLQKEMTLMEMLDMWLRDMVFPGKLDEFIQEIDGQGEPGESRRKLRFYTSNHCYNITAIERTNGKRSYLGCVVIARKERPGEDWKRGNDLPDGDFTKDTWYRILNSIICYELERISVYIKPDSIPEDAIKEK